MPESPEDIRDAIEGLERYDGVTASIGDVEIEAHRDSNLRISGDAGVVVRVRR